MNSAHVRGGGAFLKELHSPGEGHYFLSQPAGRHRALSKKVTVEFLKAFGVSRGCKSTLLWIPFCVWISAGFFLSNASSYWTDAAFSSHIRLFKIDYKLLPYVLPCNAKDISRILYLILRDISILGIRMDRQFLCFFAKDVLELTLSNHACSILVCYSNSMALTGYSRHNCSGLCRTFRLPLRELRWGSSWVCPLLSALFFTFWILLVQHSASHSCSGRLHQLPGRSVCMPAYREEHAVSTRHQFLLLALHLIGLVDWNLGNNWASRNLDFTHRYRTA